MKTTIVSVFYNSERPSGPIEDIPRSKCGSSEGGLVAKCGFTRPNLENARDAERTDKFIEDYKGSITDLMNARELKPQFDSIVKNWPKISNESVARIKEFIRTYAAENGVTLPAGFKVTNDMSALNPTLVIEDPVGQRSIKIFNSGSKSLSGPGSTTRSFN